MMNEKELEDLRIKYLIKFVLLLILPSLLIAVFLYISVKYLISINLIKTVFDVFLVVITTAIICLGTIFILASFIPKEYENTVKKHLLKIAFQRIPDLVINWEGTEIEKPKTIDEIKKMLTRSTFFSDVINSTPIEDDMFWGTYKGKNFIIAEGHDITSRAVFNGTILNIEINNKFNNRVLILKKVFFPAETWRKTVKNGLNKLSFNTYYNAYLKNLDKVNLNLNNNSINFDNLTKFYNNYEIYTKNSNDVDSILNENLINKINKKQNYSYIIEDKNLYIIIPHETDKFKFGNLFKKVNDESQYQSCYDDINEILEIIDCFDEYSF